MLAGRPAGQISHGFLIRLTGRHRTKADSLDIQWTLTCGYGFWLADRTGGIDLRVGMAEPGGDHMHPHASQQQGRGVDVPQIMRPGVR